MGDKHLSAPECIADLYSLFAWVMPKSNHNYFGISLCEAQIYDLNITLDLYYVQFGSCDPYINIQYSKKCDLLWYKDIYKYEQKPSKKSSC